MWFLCMMLIPIALLALAVGFSDFRETALVMFLPGSLLTAIPLFLLVALPFGPLGKELGWPRICFTQTSRPLHATDKQPHFRRDLDILTHADTFINKDISGIRFLKIIHPADRRFYRRLSYKSLPLSVFHPREWSKYLLKER